MAAAEQVLVAGHLLAADLLIPAGRAALAFVLNAAWLAPLVVGAGALMARLMRRAPTRTRHQVWTLVLGIAVIAPALGAFGLGGAMPPAPDAPAPDAGAFASGDGG